MASTNFKDGITKIVSSWLNEVDEAVYGGVANVTQSPYNADPTGVADSTAAIQAASDATEDIYIPAGTYRLDSGLTTAGGFVGADSAKTIFNFYGTGTAIYHGGATGDVGHFSVVSQGANQNGFHYWVGTGGFVGDIISKDFDGFGAQIGEAGVGGCYFLNIDYIECNNSNTAGTTAFIVDGLSAPNSNANVIKNVFTKGKWATHYDVRGNKNIFIGGDAEFDNSSLTITEVYKVSGIGNEFNGPYLEQVGATFPSVLVNFTSTANSNRFVNGYLPVTSPAGGMNTAITDDGVNNEFESNANGFNFPFAGSKRNPTNLLPNTAWKIMDTTANPRGWIATTGGTGGGAVTRESSTILGTKYSMKLEATNGRANLNCWITATTPSVRNTIPYLKKEALRGRTVLAGVWCLTTVANMGGLKIYNGSTSSGTNKHSGSGNWEFLTVSARIDDAANEIALEFRTDKDNADKTGVVYFSDPIFVLGVELPMPHVMPLRDDYVVMNGPFIGNNFIAFGSTDTTPDVSDGNNFITGGAVTFTDFDNGLEGQTIIISAEHSVTVTDGTNILLAGSANFDMVTTDTLTLIQKADNKWYELSRSVN